MYTVTDTYGLSVLQGRELTTLEHTLQIIAPMVLVEALEKMPSRVYTSSALYAALVWPDIEQVMMGFGMSAHIITALRPRLMDWLLTHIDRIEALTMHLQYWEGREYRVIGGTGITRIKGTAKGTVLRDGFSCSALDSVYIEEGGQYIPVRVQINEETQQVAFTMAFRGLVKSNLTMFANIEKRKG